MSLVQDVARSHDDDVVRMLEEVRVVGDEECRFAPPHQPFQDDLVEDGCSYLRVECREAIVLRIVSFYNYLFKSTFVNISKHFLDEVGRVFFF